MEEVWRLLKRRSPKVLLFLGLWLILGLGISQLLSFVPDFILYSVIEDDQHDDAGRVGAEFALSVMAGLGLTTLGFHVYFEQKKKLERLEDALSNGQKTKNHKKLKCSTDYKKRLAQG